MSKHTPGPWRVVPRKCNRGNTVGHEVRAKNPNAKSDRGENILFVSPDSSVPSAEANARLIAAAPELLKACKAALTLPLNRYDEDGFDHLEKIERIATQVGAAIKKAGA